MKNVAILIAAVMSFGAMATPADTATEKALTKQELQQKAEKAAKELHAKKAQRVAEAKKEKANKEEDKQ